jgi:hypothetical protein
MSRRTRMNWLIDAAVFVGAVLAMLSGVYFLYLPSGGYQGSDNAAYGVTILGERATWSDLHTWGGVLMIAAVLVHLVFHWEWVKMMARRIVKRARMSKGARINLVVDMLVALSFVLTAASGLYFLFAPSGGYQGGRNPGWDAGFVFSRTTWDLIHTWSGVALIVTALLHIAIHWRWIKKVTVKLFASLWPQPATS